jgi:uroporphyrinogen-III synthase
VNGPLHDRQIVNTRAVHQAAPLDDLLRARGAIPLAYPCIATALPEHTAALDAALHALCAGHYDWLVLTSANTVRSLAERLQALDLKLTGPFKVAAVGPGTAEAAESMLGVSVTLIPDEHVAESLATAILARDGGRILLPESAIARPVLAQMLATGGAEVCTVEAYHTVAATGGVDLPALLRAHQVDAVIFTSSSTVTHFLDRLAAADLTPAALDGVCIAPIGPKTARTVRDCGLEVAFVPQAYTLAGLVDSLEQYFMLTTAE